ncbi:MAG: 50S ribosomal protein L21e [Thermoplasmatota archaeon]
MVVRSKGLRSKTRHKLQKPARARGRPPVTHSLRAYPAGSKVAIVINPSVHDGQPHPRFQGLTGVIVERRGGSFVLEVRVGHKPKTLIARPEHLRAIVSN